MTWKDVIIKLVDMITEDKLMAMFCLTIIGLATIMKYPVSESLPILTAIVSGVAGFVTGIAMKKKD